VTAPSLLIGLLLLAVTLGGVWSINRLQKNLASILAENVTSLEAAQELEITLRQLRFHAFLYVVEPTPARRELMAKDHRAFEAALDQARRSANDPEEERLVKAIQEGYLRYREGLPVEGTTTGALPSREALRDWVRAHPVRHLVAPCEELFRLNKRMMEQSARESEEVSQRTRLAMLLLGILGPLSGLVGGFGIARGLSRSVARVRVRVEDVNAELGLDAGSVRLSAGGDLRDLEEQLGQVVGRVREVVAQLHRQQQEMLRTEQLAAVGKLAASVAHEVRNPLTSVKLLVGAALKGGAGQALTADDLAVIHGEIERLEQTVQNLLDFARPQSPRRESADLRDCAARALGLVGPRARRQGVEIRLRQPDAAVAADLDAGQMHTVLVNLLLNALDAMPEGGTLEVLLEGGCGDEARVRVCDTGPGIAPEATDRLFTAFASTKRSGTGLGLSNSRRILQEHGGDISAENRPSGGACFLLTLPSRTQESAGTVLA
jgi:signal transduction histidine kinase